MKAKIDEKGNLWLDRVGELKEQCCPFQHATAIINQVFAGCGDRCPLFILTPLQEYITSGGFREEGYKLDLCHNKKYYIKENNFTDERIRNDSA